MSETMRSAPAIAYPPELPISERRDELMAAIEANQVVIVAGETGSGKSTQLPKMCLELGRGSDKLIGHTQPRRLAARTIAGRIASELDTQVGELVGYTVRFNDRVGSATRLRLMTDGILLAELPRDRRLHRYDTIIIDEAHERSLNIDFILGYLKQLLPRRPDLKVIVTSATIDTERFSRHFDDAPVIEVSGRTHPVEVRYRPLDGPATDEPLDEIEGIQRAVRELWRDQPGDILVFCSGEREIRDAADAVGDLGLPGIEVLPLFARLSAGEQQRVFASHSKRRVVIATNVAETSVTVPGVRSVIDVGTARISRFGARTKVQRLPIEDISQASADQRKGRCGRIGPGVCIRLYSEDDYQTRPEFTEPEIQRTNLASVILQMASLGLGDIARFPFVDRPDDRAIRDGVDLLHELHAIDPDRQGTRKWLTPIGRKLAKLPVDPRYGRMLLEADANGCVPEVTIIIAALAVQDPRERPREKREAADESHRRFADESSDFLSWLNLWSHVEHQRRTRTRNQFRRQCHREFLNYHRVVEWQDIHTQLRQVAKELDLRTRRRGRDGSGHRRKRDRNHQRGEGPVGPLYDLDPELRDAIHRSILAGLLSHIGTKDTKESKPARRQGRSKRRSLDYLGARGTRFAIAPGSVLFKSSPKWLMAAELVETTRLWARQVAGLDPDWIEPLADHLATYSYGEPWWDAERGSALVPERVTLYGLTLVANRAVALHTVDPDLARELFIHHALIEGELTTDHRFLAANAERIAEIEALEARSRRRDLLVEQQIIHDFYHSRIPADITTTSQFDSWWKSERHRRPDLLDLTPEDLRNPEAVQVDHDAFPDSWRQGDLDLELAYEFDPASHLDGVSVLVPVEVLEQLDPAPFQWSVPGLREELVNALVRSLPKSLRRNLVPVNETVSAVLPDLDPDHGPLLDVLARHLGNRAGLVIPTDAFDLDKVPDHLRPTFRVINDRYELLAEGKDVPALRHQLTEEVRSSIAQLTQADHGLERSGLQAWDVGRLPPVVETGAVKAYPALVDEHDSVAVRLFATPDEQADAHWLGVRRLLRLNLPSLVRQLDRALPDRVKLQMFNPHVQSKAGWYNDAIDCALDAVITSVGGPPTDRSGWDRLVSLAREQVDDLLVELAGYLIELLAVLGDIHTRLDQFHSESYTVSVADVRAHLARLAYPGFLAGVGHHRLDDVVRYLRGISIRLDGLPKNPTRDIETLTACRRLDNEWVELATTRPGSAAVEDIAWMLEELRVSLFAQTLGAKGRISEKRIRRALNQARNAA
jgi:ATP-dependent helicase HrpA